jgi:hypothetical protein
MSNTWPPPPNALAPWHTQTLDIARRGRVPVKVREVFLWGQEVLIDKSEAAIWCTRCRRFVPVLELRTRGVHAFDTRSPRGVFVPVTCTPPAQRDYPSVDLMPDLEDDRATLADVAGIQDLPEPL